MSCEGLSSQKALVASVDPRKELGGRAGGHRPVSDPRPQGCTGRQLLFGHHPGFHSTGLGRPGNSQQSRAGPTGAGVHHPPPAVTILLWALLWAWLLAFRLLTHTLPYIPTGWGAEEHWQGPLFPLTIQTASRICPFQANVVTTLGPLGRRHRSSGSHVLTVHSPVCRGVFRRRESLKCQPRCSRSSPGQASSAAAAQAMATSLCSAGRPRGKERLGLCFRPPGCGPWASSSAASLCVCWGGRARPHMVLQALPTRAPVAQGYVRLAEQRDLHLHSLSNRCCGGWSGFCGRKAWAEVGNRKEIQV